MDTLKNIGLYLFGQFTSFGFFDILDIAIVSVIFYYIFKFVSDRRAGKLAVGIIFIVAALAISEFLRMNTLNFLLGNVVQVGIIGLVILFQSELRSLLEKMGGSSIIGSLDKKTSADIRDTLSCIDNVVSACTDFSKERTGALLVFERSTKLGDVIKTGTVINADPDAFLIKNIFHNKAPLHDGAMIIRDNRIYSAGCFLPLSQNADIIKDLGTRHRAGIGMSETSDAIVVIVSEETGTISIAENGKLKRGFDETSLKNELIKYLIGEENKDRKHKSSRSRNGGK